MIPVGPGEFQSDLFGDAFNPLTRWYASRFEEVDPKDFYREIFPQGALEADGEEVEGRYRGIAVRVRNGHAQRHFITDSLSVVDEACAAEPGDFWIASPVSYAGFSQSQDRARFLYAIAVDLDAVRIEDPNDPRGLGAMWNQILHGLQPRPSFTVSSGSGLHLYYVLEQPIALYRNVIAQLKKFRHDLIKLIWDSYVTEDWQFPQYESVTQCFRMVGSRTKKGDIVRAWRTGERLSIEKLNEWVEPKHRVTEVHFQSALTLAQARERFPEWYQRRIVEGKPRGSWTPSRALYEWWRDKKLWESQTGHRYFYLMCLAIFAMKCGVSKDELTRDAWRLVPTLRIKDTPGNPLRDDDVMKALELYDACYQTFPRRSIEALAGIPLPPNKRNGRKQAVHLRGARAIQAINDEANGTDWRYHGGAPTKCAQVLAWREANPGGSKAQCERDTGISRHTVLKWWDAKPEPE